MKDLFACLAFVILFASPIAYFVNSSINEGNDISNEIEDIKNNDSTVGDVIYHNGTYYIIKK